MDGLVRTLDKAYLAFSDIIGKTVSSYCRLESARDEYILEADDGTMLTFLELKGSLRRMGTDEINYAVNMLTEGLSGFLEKRGHCIQFVMQANPESSKEDIDTHFEPMKATAKAMGIDIDSIMDDTRDKLSKFAISERVWVVLWTYPYALPAVTKNKGNKAKKRAQVPDPDAYTMDISSMDSLKNTHENFVNAVNGSMERSGLLCEIMEAHEALHAVRKCIDTERTLRNWRPVLPGDRIKMRHPDAGEDKPIRTSLPPSLKLQLFPRPAFTDDETVQIGSLIHRSFSMEVGPETEQAFNRLHSELIKQTFGWRISMHIYGDGLAGEGGLGKLKTTIKKNIALVLSFASDANKQYARSIAQLKEMKLANRCIAGLEINFDTWVDIRDYQTEKDALDDLATNCNYFVSCIQGWGTMDVREVSGDPLLPLCSTVPGLMLKTPSARPAPPLDKAFYMAPFTRPASPWTEGTFLARSADGKLFPIMPMSSLQASWLEVGAGGLGSGKSFFINTHNLSYIFQPGLDELPYLSIIDVGPSSSGLIRLLQTALPPDQQKYVAAFKLRMDEKYAVNFFDTPVGLRIPFRIHMDSIVSFLTTFCTPLGRNAAPADGVTEFLAKCVRLAYEDLSDNKKPKLYQPGLNAELDEKIQRIDIEIDDKTSWWEVVDTFFKENLHHEAILAQRYAVPLLGDIIKYTTKSEVTQMYQFKEGNTGQPITEYINRKLIEATSKYPLFTRPTQFDIGEARIVSLDLNDVISKQGDQGERQTGIMYMLAMHLLSEKFFYTVEDTENIGKHWRADPNREIWGKYRQYHYKRIKKIGELAKKIVLDEFHNAANTGPLVDRIVRLLETIGLESRKWLISLGFWSQHLEHLPEDILRLANSAFFLGDSSADTKERITKMFALNSSGKSALNRLRKPDSRGANFFAVLRTSHGEVQQLLTNTVGPQMLWAFSTVKEDMAVRNELYDRIGVQETLKALAHKYPGGIKEYIEAKRLQLSREGKKLDVIEDIVKKIESEVKEARAHAA